MNKAESMVRMKTPMWLKLCSIHDIHPDCAISN